MSGDEIKYAAAETVYTFGVKGRTGLLGLIVRSAWRVTPPTAWYPLHNTAMEAPSIILMWEIEGLLRRSLKSSRMLSQSPGGSL